MENKVQNLLGVSIDKIKENGITQEEFDISKNAMYGSMVVDFENVEEVATNIASAHFKGRTAYTALETFGIEGFQRLIFNIFSISKS